MRQQIETAAIWDAYCVAYEQRYDTKPIRNAKVNGQVLHLSKRLPHDSVQLVIRAYLRSNNARYVQSGHALGPLLQDAEALHTEATTGRSRTSWGAREADKRDGRSQEFQDLFAELRAEDEAKARLKKDEN